MTKRRWDDRIKLRHLRTVLAVQDCGSVTGAAERLFISQAAVSKAIAEVEEALGADLFERRGRAIVPTEAGHRFIRTGRRIAAEIRVLEEEIDLLATGGAGLVTIGLQAVSAQAFLVRAVAAMKRRYPKITIRLVEGMLPDVLRDLRSGRFDLAIGRMVPALMGPDLDGAPIVLEPYVVVASVGHPVLALPRPGWADVLAHSWCLPLRGTPVREHLDEHLAELVLPQPESLVETGSVVTILMLLQSMPLLALAPRHLARDWEARGHVALTPLTLSPRAEPIGLIWSTALPLAPAARVFRDETLALLKEGGPAVTPWPDILLS
ncbi:LysR family transcriptional regulator [Inquilinus limosus]|uniref:LysR family transcriptional regulator n=1 Tax=Inquilinus limosus TaxID=171674 RepID=UPI0003F91AE6|nr:LysR family transcriptional regulator [Inquilinus limosus]